jgi:hypothetical protein
MQHTALGQPLTRGILGVESRLDRVSVRGGRLLLEPVTSGDRQLQPHQIQALDGLGHGVLDL